MSGLDEAEYTMQSRLPHQRRTSTGPSWRRRARTWARSRAWATRRTSASSTASHDYDGLGLDGPRALPYEHPRLVGRRPSVHAAELVGGAQRRNIQLRREPPLRRAVRIRLRPCRPTPRSSPTSFDLLARRHGLSQELAAHIMTAPSWEAIDAHGPAATPPSRPPCAPPTRNALVNGPFSIIVGSEEGLLALNDRLKLRALMAAEKGSMVYLASEQAAIEVVCPDAEHMRAMGGGEPFVVQLDSVAKAKAAAAGQVNEPRNAPLRHEVGVLPDRHVLRKEALSAMLDCLHPPLQSAARRRRVHPLRPVRPRMRQRGSLRKTRRPAH